MFIFGDSVAKFFYVGGHLGLVEDRYICSSKPMLRAYSLRSNTFKFKVLQYVYGCKKKLRECEQYWLNLIKDSELMSTTNVQNKTCRYYNVKKHAAGGNGSANKGNSNIGGHNKGKPMSEEQKIKIRAAKLGKKFSEAHKAALRKSKMKRRDSVSTLPPGAFELSR